MVPRSGRHAGWGELVRKARHQILRQNQYGDLLGRFLMEVVDINHTVIADIGLGSGMPPVATAAVGLESRDGQPQAIRVQVDGIPAVHLDTMDRFSTVAEDTPGKIRFIHLNHTNPAFSNSEIEKQIRERGFRIALQGERVGL